MIPEARFYQAIRKFAAQTKPYETAVRYWTVPDEAYDLTLVSQRVYGNRHEYLAVMAAAGLDRMDQELTPRTLVLPTASKLKEIKKVCGYTGPGDVS